MQNEHQNFFCCWCPNVRGGGRGGGQAGWDKIPSLAKEINFWLPLQKHPKRGIKVRAFYGKNSTYSMEYPAQNGAKIMDYLEKTKANVAFTLLRSLTTKDSLKSCVESDMLLVKAIWAKISTRVRN